MRHGDDHCDARDNTAEARRRRQAGDRRRSREARCDAHEDEAAAGDPEDSPRFAVGLQTRVSLRAVIATAASQGILGRVTLSDADSEARDFGGIDDPIHRLDNTAHVSAIDAAAEHGGGEYFELKPRHRARTLRFTANSRFGPAAGCWRLRGTREGSGISSPNWR